MEILKYKYLMTVFKYFDESPAVTLKLMLSLKTLPRMQLDSVFRPVTSDLQYPPPPTHHTTLQLQQIHVTLHSFCISSLSSVPVVTSAVRCVQPRRRTLKNISSFQPENMEIISIRDA